jgi:hypothetical protein
MLQLGTVAVSEDEVLKQLDLIRTWFSTTRDAIDMRLSPSVLHILIDIGLRVTPLAAPPPRPTTPSLAASPVRQPIGNHPTADADVDADATSDDDSDTDEGGPLIRQSPLPQQRRHRASTMTTRVTRIKIDRIFGRLVELFRRFLNNGADPNALNHAGDPLASVLLRIAMHEPVNEMVNASYHLLYELLKTADIGLNLSLPASICWQAFYHLYGLTQTDLDTKYPASKLVHAFGPWISKCSPVELTDYNALTPRQESVRFMLKAACNVNKKFANCVGRCVTLVLPVELAELVAQFLFTELLVPHGTINDDQTVFDAYFLHQTHPDAITKQSNPKHVQKSNKRPKLVAEYSNQKQAAEQYNVQYMDYVYRASRM